MPKIKPKHRHAPAERYAHADNRVERASNTVVGESAGEHVELLQDWPVARLKKDGKITADMEIAANKFYRDWYVGGLCPHKSSHGDLSAVYGGFGSRDRLAPTEAAANARNRYHKALKAVSKPARPYVCGIVLEELSPATVGRSHGLWRCNKQAQACAVTSLQFGLSDLSVFYGISTGGKF